MAGRFTAARVVVVGALAGAGAVVVVACSSDYGGGGTASADGSVDGAGASDTSASLDAAEKDGGCSAVELDGVGSVVVAASAELDLTPPFTIEAWIRPKGAVKEQHVLSHHDHGASQGWAFMLQGPLPDQAGASLRLYGPVTDAGPNIYSAGFGTGSQPTNDKWAHVALTMAPGEITVWVDGVKKDSTLGVPGGFPAPFAGALRMGRTATTTGGPDFPFVGTLDEVRLSKSVRYSSAFEPPLTAASVDAYTIALWHFDEGAGTTARDATGRHDGILSDGARWVSVSCSRR